MESALRPPTATISLTTPFNLLFGRDVDYIPRVWLVVSVGSLLDHDHLRVRS